MTIEEGKFDNEAELQTWVEAHFNEFFPNAQCIPGFRITTSSGKHGFPDGFAFDFGGHEWFVVENELLQHGVWPHIAEQVTRFVVATKNPASLRLIRDRLFAFLSDNRRLAEVAVILGVPESHLLQRIELFVESTPPRLVIFIDDVNQDLQDMADALDSPTSVFQIRKFLVNGQREYYSPDRNAPAIVTEPEDKGAVTGDLEVVDRLGGGEVAASVRRFKVYRVSEGRLVYIKRSKFHEKYSYYWYGLGATALEYCDEHNVTHIVLLMGEEGMCVVPIAVVKNFLPHTGVSREGEQIRHYHLLVSPGPEPELYWSKEGDRISLDEYFQPF